MIQQSVTTRRLPAAGGVVETAGRFFRQALPVGCQWQGGSGDGRSLLSAGATRRLPMAGG